MTRDDLRGALTHDNVGAFLHVIREGETSNDEIAYRTFWGGSTFESFADHPRKHFPLPNGKNTSAAGAYQITETTWNDLVSLYRFTDFSPATQDEAAVALLARRHALEDVIAGRVNEAVRRLGQEWTSLAIQKRIKAAPEVFAAYGGRLGETDSPPPQYLSATPIAQEVKPVGIFAALLPTILQAIPQLISVFGSATDSDVAKRNQQAGIVVADTLIKATNASNLADAVGKLQSDPAALDAAHAAVNALLPTLLEAGDGGIAAARKSASSGDQIPFYKNPAFIIAALLTPLVYMVAVEILFNPSGQIWSDDIKMMFVTAIVSGLLGSITGFFLGSSLGSQKKDAALAK